MLGSGRVMKERRVAGMKVLDEGGRERGKEGRKEGRTERMEGWTWVRERGNLGK